MRNSINTLVLSLLLYSCTNAGSNNESATNGQIQQDTTFLAKQQIELKQKIRDLYDDKISIDTIMVIESDSFDIHLEYYCLKESDLVIPSTYYELGGDFKTHDFASKLEIKNSKGNVLNELLDKSTFDKLLSDELKKYGVLISPSVSVVYKGDQNLIRVHHSVTIPGTDLGTSVTFYLNQSGEKMIDQY